MKGFMSFCFVAICTAAVLAVLYNDGYLDYTPLYDIISSVRYIKSERVSSPIKTGAELSFNPAENISIDCVGDTVYISTNTSDADKKYLVAFIEENDIETTREEAQAENGKATITIAIPNDAGDKIEVAVYANSQQYGTFRSWINNYVYFVRTSNGWQKEKPPVLNHNTEVFSQPKILDSALEETRNVEANNPSVMAEARRITAQCSTDYEKALALHDYVCETLYYDMDMASRNMVPVESAADVLLLGRGVCSGYANVYAALCRSIGLPCVVVTGYAVGSELFDTGWNEENIASEFANHAWNEVYADGRWIIVDTTWDSGNIYKHGKTEESADPMHLYFDANLEYFSTNHKILKYKDI